MKVTEVFNLLLDGSDNDQDAAGRDRPYDRAV